MQKNKNDKYKKRYILKQIENKWGYYEFDGSVVLIKNCILKEKYNKIYQIIFNGGDTIDGLYLINSFDINVEYESEEDRFFRITNKKYDKIAGYDDFTVHSFTSREKFIDWLIKNDFLDNSELSVLKDYTFDELHKSDLLRSVLDS